MLPVAGGRRVALDELAEHVEKGLLENIEGQLAVPRVPVRQAHHPVAVPPVQNFERVNFAPVGSRDQLLVAGLVTARVWWFLLGSHGHPP
jgi:hypothetical protein